MRLRSFLLATVCVATPGCIQPCFDPEVVYESHLLAKQSGDCGEELTIDWRLRFTAKKGGSSPGETCAGAVLEFVEAPEGTLIDGGVGSGVAPAVPMQMVGEMAHSLLSDNCTLMRSFSAYIPASSASFEDAMARDEVVWKIDTLRMKNCATRSEELCSDYYTSDTRVIGGN